jgi:hypothetical protein
MIEENYAPQGQQLILVRPAVIEKNKAIENCFMEQIYVYPTKLVDF